MTFLFCFVLYDAYNIIMVMKYREDNFTHPPHDSQLWLEQLINPIKIRFMVCLCHHDI
jgi:hypothetical protein